MGWLRWSSLTHMVQRIKVQVGTSLEIHVINRCVVGRLHRHSHRVTHSHAHGRRCGRWCWAAVVRTELQTLHRLYG